MYNFEGVDSIYFRQTKDYFQEVISSYSIGNYRSANVMLYSVVICDLLFKLQELKDMYNDSVAISILKEVDSLRDNKGDYSKSSWESKLVERINKETKLLELDDYTNIRHLYDNRNFSAHPALNANYELITPSKETTAANIKNALKIFVKPPIFIKQVVDYLVEDLKDKKAIYEHDYDELKTYLYNKYYSRMTISMKLKTIKALWKFCFKLPDNPDCMENIVMNRRALECLIDTIPKETSESIKDNPLYFSISSDEVCCKHAVILIAKYPELYRVLDSSVQRILEIAIDKYDGAKLLAWFKYTTFDSHINYLRSCRKIACDKGCIDYMFDHYSEIGLQNEVLQFFIDFYGASYLYDVADHRFDCLIKPYLSYMNENHFISLIEQTNDNDQLYARREARYANNTILRVAKNVLPFDFDYSSFEHFKYSDYIINPQDQSDDSEIDFS